jgi:hypothetical protein
MMTFPGGLSDWCGGFFSDCFSRTKSWSPMVSTFHELTGPSAGARSDLAGAKTETGVMPPAADGIAHNKTVSEWSTIMRSGRP